MMRPCIPYFHKDVPFPKVEKWKCIQKNLHQICLISEPEILGKLSSASNFRPPDHYNNTVSITNFFHYHRKARCMTPF